MRYFLILISLLFFIIFSSMPAYADNNDITKFTLKIKPSQQNIEVNIDNNGHKDVQVRAEYVKLNTVTNNHHIKVTITNNSGEILYHQLAMIDKVDGSEIKYPDSIADYENSKAIPYYNYGNIKVRQATFREWYLSNTGKDEIEVKGYLVNKDISIVLDPKIASANPGVAETVITYVRALRDNDIYMLLGTIPNNLDYMKLKYDYIQVFIYSTSRVIQSSYFWEKPNNIEISGNVCWLEYIYINPNDGHVYPWTLVLIYDDTKWWITK